MEDAHDELSAHCQDGRRSHPSPRFIPLGTEDGQLRATRRCPALQQEDDEVDKLRAQIQEYARKAKIMQERVDKKVSKVEKKEKTKQGFQDDQ